MKKPAKPRTIKGKPYLQKSVGTWAEFEKRYEPIEKADGSLLYDFEEIMPCTDVRNIWTVIDCDGKTYLSAGFRFVNRLGYLICFHRRGDGNHRDYRY